MNRKREKLRVFQEEGEVCAKACAQGKEELKDQVVDQGQEEEIQNEMKLERDVKVKSCKGRLTVLRNFVTVIRTMGCHRVYMARLHLHCEKITVLWFIEHVGEQTGSEREQTSQQPCAVIPAEETRGRVEEMRRSGWIRVIEEVKFTRLRVVRGSQT